MKSGLLKNGGTGKNLAVEVEDVEVEELGFSSAEFRRSKGTTSLGRSWGSVDSLSGDMEEVWACATMMGEFGEALAGMGAE